MQKTNAVNHKEASLLELLLLRLCAGFVGCLQPVHRDKVVQKNSSK